VECFGTGVVGAEPLAAALRRVADLSVHATLERLALREVQFRTTATYGHFGRADQAYPWERLDLVDVLRELL
jgi:S-adenosylmethionine synthetase